MCSRHAHATTEYGKFIVGPRPMRMREYTAMNNKYLLSFVETPRKFIIAELSIRKRGSSSVLIISKHLCVK